MMIITYWNTLYNRESKLRVFGDTAFHDGVITFASAGHLHELPLDKVLSIELAE